jgi:hypothetical protein
MHRTAADVEKIRERQRNRCNALSGPERAALNSRRNGRRTDRQRPAAG